MSSSQNLTFSGYPTVFNLTTWNDPSLCTLSTCPKDYATLKYIPSLGANIFFLVWYILLFIAQAALGGRSRQWTFLTAMLGGCLGELIGYAGRGMMHQNIFDFNWFLMYVSPMFTFMLSSETDGQYEAVS